MDNIPAFERQGVFRFMDLPAEVRCSIYYFAVFEPHPLPLIKHHYREHGDVYSVEKDLRMLGTSSEFRTEMQHVLYSENSFSYSIPLNEVEVGTKTFPLDLRRIQKCCVSVDDIIDWDDGDVDPELSEDVFGFHKFMANFIFKSHQLKYLLVECKPQNYKSLAEGLSPLSMLRNIHLVHFSSFDAEMHHYFRFLEGLMMGDQPMPFSDSKDFWGRSSCGDDLVEFPDWSWLVEGLDTSSLVFKSKSEIKDSAKELHAIFGIESGVISESESE